ncbi:MAG: endonuclease [Defluviitaleaceae bacterium]|nr:endonuclease [Defluviitaleaceae bacterium]
MLMEIYNQLFNRYGDLNWWPAESPYEVIIGATLTQNTNWSNVELALANFKKNITPYRVKEIDLEELKEIIRPAGFYNQKAVYLKAITKWYERYDFDVNKVKAQPLDRIRKELLAVRGVGNETADSILLYAFDFPTFVIDKYTQRFCQRYGIEAGKDYMSHKNYFEANLLSDRALFNNYHALIVINAKNHCKAKPTCRDCPLEDTCGQLGFDDNGKPFLS